MKSWKIEKLFSKCFWYLDHGIQSYLLDNTLPCCPDIMTPTHCHFPTFFQNRWTVLIKFKVMMKNVKRIFSDPGYIFTPFDVRLKNTADRTHTYTNTKTHWSHAQSQESDDCRERGETTYSIQNVIQRSCWTIVIFFEFQII